MAATGSGRALDLTGVAAHHRQARPRWTVKVQLGIGTVWAATGVLRLVRGEGGLAALSLVPGLLWLVLAVVTPRRPPSTSVDADGLLLRQPWGRTRVPWGDVEEVLVQGRWAETSRVRVRGGRLSALPGVAPEQARRLADALAAARAG